MARLPLVDNQPVKAGQTLFVIEPEPFALALAAQKAAIDVANANLKKALDQTLVATNEINSAQATLVDAQKNRDRVLQLARGGTDTPQAADNAERDYRVALAALNRAQNSKIVAEQEQVVQRAVITQAQVAMAQAAYDLKQTEVVAPTAGRVAPLRIRVGQFVTVGTPGRRARCRQPLACRHQSAGTTSGGPRTRTRRALFHQLRSLDELPLGHRAQHFAGHFAVVRFRRNPAVH